MQEMDPFYNLLNGKVDYFKEVSLEVLLNSRDKNGDSLLSRAVMEQKLDCVKEIYRRCPSLLYCESTIHRYNALQHAAARNELEILKFIINADAESQGRGAEKRLTRMQDTSGNAALMIALKNGKYANAVKLIEADLDFHHPPDSTNQTPLKLCMSDPSRKEIFKKLLEIAPLHSKTPMGLNGWTVLHYAADSGVLNAIEDILLFCPECSEVVDNKGQNFLHIAAQSGHIQVVKHVLGGNRIPDSVLNMKDNDGNTPLHIAALSGNDNLTLCFLYDSSIDKTTVNKNMQHVLSVINFYYDKRKAGVRAVMNQVDQRDLKDQSDFDLVVCALIATVSFTAGITVPGGYISDEPNKGNAVLSKNIAFKVFVISNTFALLLSLYAVFSHYCTRHLVKTKDIIYQLKVATFCTMGAIYAMIAAFIAGSFAVLANSNGLAISVCVISSCFYILSIRPMWKIVMQGRHIVR